MGTLHGVPNVEGKSLILSELQASKNPFKHNHTLGTFQGDKVKILHNGKKIMQIFLKIK